MDTMLVLMLALSALAWQQATCQLVETRANEDKIAPTSVSPKAAVYQRHLSPHRMMHFGKRPIYQSAPLLLAPVPPQPLAPPASYPSAALGDSLFVDGLQFLPNLVSLTVERGQAFQPLISDEGSPLTMNAPASIDAVALDPLVPSDPLSRMRYIIDSLPQAAANTDYLYPSELPFSSHLRPRATPQPTSASRQQYQPQVFNAKLMSSDDRETTTDKRSMSSNSGNAARASVGFLTKYTNALPYIKKADTKDNFFMHFGRK